jgi:hypothetical protein
LIAPEDRELWENYVNKKKEYNIKEAENAEKRQKAR